MAQAVEKKKEESEVEETVKETVQRDVLELDFKIDPVRGQEKLRSKFGYFFNEDGRCRSVKDVDKGVGRLPSQKAYEAFGDEIESFVFNVLENDMGLDRYDESEDARKKGAAPCTVFTSKKYLDADTLLLIVPGSGTVRSGYWARQICINNYLAAGTCIPFIASAHRRGMGVLLFDPNQRLDRQVLPTQHCRFIFDKFVRSPMEKGIAKWTNLLIVAHSAGGFCTSDLLGRFHSTLSEKKLLKGVAFTDCGTPREKWLDSGVAELYARGTVNFVASRRPLGTVIEKGKLATERSAGHDKHEWTSAAAYTEIFKFFDGQLGKSYRYDESVRIDLETGERVKK